MDMVVGRNYVNILVDRCLFQNAINEDIDNVWELQRKQCIRVQRFIREMVIYIGEKEENCVFRARRQNFPEIHNEYCKISVFHNDIENLPT